MTYIVILRDGSTVRFERIRALYDDRLPGIIILVSANGDYIYVIMENVAVIMPEDIPPRKR